MGRTYCLDLALAEERFGGSLVIRYNVKNPIVKILRRMKIYYGDTEYLIEFLDNTIPTSDHLCLWIERPTLVQILASPNDVFFWMAT